MNLEELKGLISEHNLTDEVALWATNETDKGKELLNNFSQQTVKKSVDERTREIYESFDKDLNELGIDKAGRKTYEAYKDAVLSSRDKISELEKLASKDPDQALLAEIESIRSALENKDSELNTLRSETLEANKRRIYLEAMKGMEFDERHDPSLMQLKVDSLINDFVNRTDNEGDNWIIKDSLGQIMLNNEHKPIDAHEALKTELSSYLKSNKPKGIGANASQEGSQGGTLSVSIDKTKLASLSGLDKKQAAMDLLSREYSAKNLDVHSEQFTKDFKVLTS